MKLKAEFQVLISDILYVHRNLHYVYAYRKRKKNRKRKSKREKKRKRKNKRKRNENVKTFLRSVFLTTAS